MSSQAAHISVLAGERCACVKIQGRANFTSSIDFDAVVTQLRDRGFTHFVIELSECSLMDSTFLGTLAGFGLKMGDGGSQPKNHPIELLNANTRIAELLENLGAIHLFTMASGQPAIPTEAHTQESETQVHSKEEMKRACLEAHETLMEITPGNVRKFTEVTQFLCAGLQNVKPKSE